MWTCLCSYFCCIPEGVVHNGKPQQHLVSASISRHHPPVFSLWSFFVVNELMTFLPAYDLLTLTVNKHDSTEASPVNRSFSLMETICVSELRPVRSSCTGLSPHSSSRDSVTPSVLLCQGQELISVNRCTYLQQGQFLAPAVRAELHICLLTATNSHSTCLSSDALQSFLLFLMVLYIFLF